MRKMKFIQHVPFSVLEKQYKKEKNPRIGERLRVVIAIYEGNSQLEAASIVKRTQRIVNEWVRRWNESGIKGLIPRKGMGRKGVLDKTIWKDIIDDIRDKGMSVEDVRKYVNREYKTSYSYKGIWNRLRRKKNGKRPVRYGKPFKIHVKRPPDAKLILKKGLKRQE